MSQPLLQHSPAQVIRQLLVDLGVCTAGTTLDWTAFASQEPDKPDNCITLYDTAGLTYGRLQTNGETQEHFGIQIRIRGRGYVMPYKKAAEIMWTMDRSVILNQVLISASTYQVHSATKRGSLNYLGMLRDNSNRDIFTLNYTTPIDEI